jgi:hypothetical protein
MMRQEGLAAVFAGASEPTLDAEEIVYSREIIAPYLDSADLPTLFACLYGDEAARSVGYTPLGLSPRAGYAVALAEAIDRRIEPEKAVNPAAAVSTRPPSP